MSIAYLLSGSNQGDRPGNLQKAISKIRELAGEITNCSPVFESPSWGFDHPSPFLNQAIEIDTGLSPMELLECVLDIENKCGRQRNRIDEYEARTLDIDILFYEDLILDTPQLTIPHPRLQMRRFALLPLSTIAGHLQHPRLNTSIDSLLQHCPDDSIVVQYEKCNCGCCKEKEDRV